MLSFPRSCLVNLVVKYIKHKCPQWNIPAAIWFKKMLKPSADKFPTVEHHIDNVAFLQYTGGTTGTAKAAMLTHRNMLSNITQARLWTSIINDPDGLEVVITPLPLYHIFSLMVNCLLYGCLGAHNILITDPRNIPALIKEFSRYPFTVVSGVNTLYNSLLNHPDFAKLDFSHFKVTLAGGMAVQHSVAERWLQVTGSVLLQAYGLTETSPGALISPMNAPCFTGAIGLPISSTEIKICDDEGQEVPRGECGELWIKGPQVMQGYWRKPEETRKVLSSDGWLKTGDIARIDETDFVYLVDRKKDMILVSGFNVYPNEIEDIVAAYDGVLEVAAIGVPDEHSGESIKLFIVKKDPTLTADRVIRYCRKNLTAYKVPKHIEFRSELPKTPVGKILRRALRNEAKAI